ncbi:electron transport complex, RnfABCDGE type, B subunit [Neisseria elongata subsp. glycolytica ATCC 29315]|uniref:Electron transport complex, RnfABCDGE type, B subunit n=1 Tax=Neisseria elongata subsp. glycolytica ATCC 29315 TaxID=546263 RepID=D4DS41_NEIEG|nr:electron transport complex, RnfABCDGE type, B subunit [Neisseria elongata subsp. glycolytica ATCC 29315]
MPVAAVEQINRLLPQTQCRECGYDGCLPYARALAAGEAAVNLCAPGGETVMLDIAGLLGKPPVAPAKTQAKALAWIDESACIGCTACIRACPVDAIMGASKLMHTVIAEECTGCGLCVAPLPRRLHPHAAERCRLFAAIAQPVGRGNRAALCRRRACASAFRTARKPQSA